MGDAFKPLNLATLLPRTGYARPFFFTPNLVRMQSSALEVMTDLRFVPAATIQPELDVETATHKMIARNVRLLIVVDDHEDVVGLITSRDLLGGRVNELAAATEFPFSGIRVAEVMTPGDQVEVLPMESVLHARVGDIVETLKDSGRQHALAVEEESFSGKMLVRGVFSASQIARQLGIALHSHELSHTFAAIDRAVARMSLHGSHG